MGRALFRYVVVVIAIGMAWKVLAAILSTQVLPPPEQALLVFFQALTTAVFWQHSLASSMRVLVAMILAWMVAFPLGIILGSNARLDAWMAPFIFLTYPIPKIVLLPVVLLLFGLGNLSKVILLWLIVGYQILVATRDGVLNLHHKYVDSVRSLGAGPWQLFREVLLPAALPHGFTALRLSTGTSVAVLFLAESFATTEGLGYFIMDAWGRMAYPQMFTGIFGMSLMGIGLFELCNALESWICAWKYVTAQSGRNDVSH
jgi:NitT/TauT family transport system permease protein